MSPSRGIWKYENDSAGRIAQGLIRSDRAAFTWKRFPRPSLYFEYMNTRKDIRLIRRNLLFTKNWPLRRPGGYTRVKAAARKWVRWT